MALKVRCACGCNLKIPGNFKGKACHCPNCSRMLDLSSKLRTATRFRCDDETKIEYGPEDLYHRVIDTVVGIKAEGFMGSGFFVSASGLVVTNHHVVEYRDEVIVRTADGTEFLGNLKRSFPDIDLAFIQTSAEPKKWATLAARGSIQVGQTVFALGHPMGYANSFTNGIVSAVGRLELGQIWIQTNAFINPGNSGGPLFNRFAQVVGVNTWIRTDAQGIGFAVPTDVVTDRLTEVTKWIQEGGGRYCTACGNASRDEKYCDHCGATFLHSVKTFDHPSAAGSAVTESVQCGTCSSLIPSDQRYCPQCGSTIERR